ncbi:response regulator transcription factor [Enterococcus sp. DIV0242_7C1]|uniref:Two-component system, OmpR family, alkaline phosphatase synthesis response regulator PhoP n=1 Tax=Candidatus Enterococcus dunnyi TaxID=1834192 RepID=A0A200JD64_9ENTE|nr:MULTISPECIES: winged helix-turn-helix domain-containing protein [unclassified Enterococcus]MBO0471753.1 response regulator transcription factor [Enterococcus sp. DIV0242_7C1]OUZ34610.1 hypothetical protein A5889_000085 [Enterococcus sp. 9D6_DIV0238]
MMGKISVINVSGEMEQSYIEELKKSKHMVESVSSKNLERIVEKTDAVIIYNDERQKMGEVCRLILKIRESATSFVWVFSKQNLEMDRLIYLQLGADNNFSEDCIPEELQLIVQRTMAHQLSTLNKRHVSGDRHFKLLVDNQSILLEDGSEIELTKLEYRLFTLLESKLNETVTYEELNQSMWDISKDHKNYRVANLIFHIRCKIERYPDSGIEIKTVRSKGYRLQLH